MAKSNLTFKRNTTDKLTVKGIMSDGLQDNYIYR